MNSKTEKCETDIHEQIERIFCQVCDLPVEEQTPVLDQLVDGDLKLRSTIAGMLQRDLETDPFFDDNSRVPDSRSFGLLNAGDIIDSYEIVRLLGEGGMGAVYLAYQRGSMQREVALKIVGSGLDSKGVISRFEAEKQVLTMFDHPNLTRIFDGGITEFGLPYFVMEHVPGDSITTFCQHNSIGLNGRLEMFVDICDAIHHAHQKGVIHRDIKPSNILVTKKGETVCPKVIDFGIAKSLDRQNTIAQTRLTIVGDVIGTPLYMSPEQAESGSNAVDVRSDIYSLGVLLFELLTGTTPLRSSDIDGANCLKTFETIRDHKTELPSSRVAQVADLSSVLGYDVQPKALSRKLQGDLDRVVSMSLAKDRNLRYETVADFRKDITNYLNGDPVSAVVPSFTYKFTKFVKKYPWSTGITALLTFGIFASGLIAINQGIQNSRSLSKNRALVTKLQEQSKCLGNALNRAEAAEVAQRNNLRFKKYEIAFERAVAEFTREQDRIAQARFQAMSPSDMMPWSTMDLEEMDPENPIPKELAQYMRAHIISSLSADESMTQEQKDQVADAITLNIQFSPTPQDSEFVPPAVEPSMQNFPGVFSFNSGNFNSGSPSQSLNSAYVVDSIGLGCLFPTLQSRDGVLPLYSTMHMPPSILMADEMFGDDMQSQYIKSGQMFCTLLIHELEEEFAPTDEFLGLANSVLAQVELQLGNHSQAFDAAENSIRICSKSGNAQLELFAKIFKHQAVLQNGCGAYAHELRVEIEHEIEETDATDELRNLAQYLLNKPSLMIQN